MSINEKALLVKMSIGQWYNQISDKKIAKEIAIQHNVIEHTQNRYLKRLLDNVALHGVRTQISGLREYHNAKTLPWKEDGVRILPSANFMEYQKTIARLRSLFEQEVKLFVAKYPTWVQQAQANMGSLFSSDDYPTADEIKDKFTLEVSTMPFPSENDFRIDIDNTAMEELRATTAQQIRTALQDATNSVRLRVLERVKLLHKALANPQKVFRDDTFYAVLSVAEDARQLNLTDDMDLTLLLNKIDFLKNYTPKMLRSNIHSAIPRQAVSDRLHEILLSYPS